VNRDTGNVLLVLVGGAILRISVGDTYLRYVKSGLQLPLLLAGAILVLLGLLSLWRDNPSRRAAAIPEAHDDGHGHGHSHGSRMAWLLLIPVFAIFLIAPPALGSYAADRSTVTRVPAQSSDYPPLPAGDPLEMRLDEYEARAVWDAGRTLGDRAFRLSGFVTAKPGGGYYVTRLVISCCAADAVAVRVLVTGETGSYPNDTWIEVVGHYDGLDHSREKDVGPIAIVRADSVRTIATPKEPYET
jgi:uncharacterized repeat protein (TIGR03943 family)